MRFVIIFVLLISTISLNVAFLVPSKSKLHSFMYNVNLRMQSFNNEEKTISNKQTRTVEIIRKKALKFPKQQQEKILTSTVADYSLYKQSKDDRISSIVMDSPVSKILELVFNPLSLCLMLYFSSVGLSKIVWLQKILKIFGKGTLAKPNLKEKEEELPPFEVYECEKCKMEMRPARGRAEIIFGRPRFRCARCGAKKDAYFNIADMNDPRAVVRLERLEEERLQKEREESSFDEDDDNDE